MLDKSLNMSTNMKYGLLIRWLLQVNLDGSPYLRETHVVGGTDQMGDTLFKTWN